MKSYITFSLFISASFFISACNISGFFTEDDTRYALVGTPWRIVVMNGQAFDIEAHGTITFMENGVASGTACCSHFSGTYRTARPDSLYLEAAYVSLALCVPEVSTYENAYLAALNTVRTYRINEDQLELIGPEGNVLLAYEAFSEPDPPLRDLDEPFEIGMEETVEINSTDMIVRFDSVSADSRCPKNVNCIWEGEAKAHFSIFVRGGASVAVTLTIPGLAPTPYEHGEGVLYGDFRFNLLELSPYPEHDRPIRQHEYSALIRVTDE